MLGTLNGALEARGICLAPDAIGATVEGINEVRERLPLLTEIRVHYHIRIPGEHREALERTLQRHASWCPSAQTLVGAVDVTWTAEIEESEGSPSSR